MSSLFDWVPILLVDDEEEILRFIQRYFSFLPDFQRVRFLTASSFQDALQVIEREKPVIVLQDINLPDGNGLQLIRQVKKTYPVIQFIVITGASDLDRVMDALSFGASDYVKKPLDMEHLHRVLAHTVWRIQNWGELLSQEFRSEEGEKFPVP